MGKQNPSQTKLCSNLITISLAVVCVFPTQVSVIAATTTVTPWRVIVSYLFHGEILCIFSLSEKKRYIFKRNNSSLAHAQTCVHFGCPWSLCILSFVYYMKWCLISSLTEARVRYVSFLHYALLLKFSGCSICADFSCQNFLKIVMTLKIYYWINKVYQRSVMLLPASQELHLFQVLNSDR